MDWRAWRMYYKAFMSGIVYMVVSISVVRSMQICYQKLLKPSNICCMSSSIGHTSLRSMQEIAVSKNSLQTFLKRDNAPLVDGSQIHPRQVKGAHFCGVLPEKVKAPYLVAVSNSCLESLEISPEEENNPEFLQYFSGNKLIPGMEIPYTTVYGTHSAGTWFGQMGDGRATYLGETHVNHSESEEEQRYYSLRLRELQLKGSGRSPFSRGFDGRAVLRSSVREFLVSEAMHHLRVPSTRALTLVGTNQGIRRPWYAANSQSNPYGASAIGDDKFPPDTLIIEPGAIVCRVSRSFLRFGHLEIFGHRKEYPELLQMADYMCLREYPHLLETFSEATQSPTSLPTDQLPDSLTPGPAMRYIELFRCIADRVAYLVAQWLRVGYVQGNMNSDNTLIAGRTMDYGPFGWIESFDPHYQPFTSDGYGNFCFIRQPTAMGVNLETLRESAIEPLLMYITSLQQDDANLAVYCKEVRKISSEEYVTMFTRHYQEVQRQKLGLSHFIEQAGDEALWTDLLKTMASSPCDYTIFFRELSKINSSSHDETAALAIVAQAFDEIENTDSSGINTYAEKEVFDEAAWRSWFSRYLQRLQTNDYDEQSRRDVMNKANPKFVLRNWMGTMAYERAEEGDFSVIKELQSLLNDPYAEHSEEMTRKWYTRTPQWAKSLPGVSFFSCSS